MARTFAKRAEKLPCVVVELAKNEEECADDIAYVTRVTMEVHCFAADGAKLEEIADAADAAMRAIGYRFCGYADHDTRHSKARVTIYRAIK
ncbi:MAG: hypothetical protein LBS72_00035 [Oscillospiraceae bacterium]|nr:hypothetical protein [Oscillospiraceae bacterium]